MTTFFSRIISIRQVTVVRNGSVDYVLPYGGISKYVIVQRERIETAITLLLDLYWILFGGRAGIFITAQVS